MTSTHIIRPWDVYRVFADRTRPPKMKLIVITHLPVSGEPYRAIYINSRRSPFMAQAHTVDWSVDIDAASHAFLSHDSVVGCNVAEDFPGILLIPSRFLGRMPQSSATAIQTAARRCKALARADKDEICGLVLPP